MEDVKIVLSGVGEVYVYTVKDFLWEGKGDNV